MQMFHFPSRDTVSVYQSGGQQVLTIGRHSYMVQYSDVVQYTQPADITIGNFCSIAADCRFLSRQDHVANWVTTYPIGNFLGSAAARGKFEHLPSKIVIGNDVWVGTGTTFMPGVTVGDGAIIGANTVVTKDVPPYAIFAGSPGRVVKPRFPEAIAEQLQRIAWWNWEEARIRQYAHLIWSDDIEAFIKAVEAP